MKIEQPDVNYFQRDYRLSKNTYEGPGVIVASLTLGQPDRLNELRVSEQNDTQYYQ